MKNPRLVGEIVKKVASSIKKPLTVKIRKGFTEESVNAVEIAKIIEDAGAAAVAVHGRTREQYYSGKADWDIIRRVKEAVSIPVIGNGDVDSPESARRLLEETGCDGIMIGRAARGNPWIFSRIHSYLENGTIPEPPSVSDVREMILKHARLHYSSQALSKISPYRHLHSRLPHKLVQNSQLQLLSSLSIKGSIPECGKCANM